MKNIYIWMRKHIILSSVSAIFLTLFIANIILISKFYTVLTTIV